MDAKRQKVEDDGEGEEEEEEAYEGEEVMDDGEEADELGEDEEGEEGEEVSEDYAEDDDRDLEEALAELQAVQDDLEKINDEASDKVLEVEQKYNEVRRPVHKQRNEVIKRIPEFWATTFANHPAIGEHLSETDKHIFTFLTELDVQDTEDVKSGYTITFKWMENPFFTDSELKKVFTFEETGTLNIEGTDIDWKKGMDPTKPAADLGGKRGREEESFFQWFYTTQQLPNGMVDEIAVTIKDDIWVSPLKYFNSEIGSDGEEYNEDEEDDEEGEEGFEEGDEEEEEFEDGDEEGEEGEEAFDEEGDEEGAEGGGEPFVTEDEEDEEEKEDGMLNDEFSDFDSNKITMSDMAAIDIGDMEDGGDDE
uniref:Uncharacterized protein n=1 Tax=Pyramimonas obovata TaxID=1411642 RepID=A0A7S0RMJ1_9CHLO|mmetsp:Transcript_38167/g.83018  ORF Transcript_38167/g.83018 Transcript_38167/m.83018 type:complete len:365 (+) Transcript_38167:226-1320(+)